MALSEDQRALLRLLLAGDTYEQVAGVLGTNPDEVRDTAHRAVEALDRAPDREFPQDAIRARLEALEGNPGAGSGARAHASGSERKRQGVAPLAGRRRGRHRRDRCRAGRQRRRGRREGTARARRAAPRRTWCRSGSPRSGAPRRVGMISVVRVADQPAVDLAIAGLEPSGPGESYVLWFVGSAGRSLPVAFHAVGADGRLTGRTPIPTAAEGLLPNFASAFSSLPPAPSVRQGRRPGSVGPARRPRPCRRWWARR